ncbi:class I SAM-dependent methyltransferase [Iningainema tapete]|uniref:Class I SAM-dependent methyltransferase n=1 Tax=Iningainema tapete BLCC-T55 TaxID=2748662 RepID=A0A8J6XBQ0_9CYAN|nr:class I SAM-dependent methyltransferase [Iningainema tapete]MBD2771834.1 class I SAM-dependent methyltransferase [Iningainema tapete BLCC-T55]
MGDNLALCEAIAHRIATSKGQRITFAEYMDMVLYHPEHGYYSTKAVTLGKHGDFFTSVHLGSDFGELLAEQFVQMWEMIGKPQPFSLVEMGAGQGILALDILKYIQQKYAEFFAVLDYIIIEKSSILKQEQQQRLGEFSVRWFNLEEIPCNSITGCFFSNELVDAMPVHQFIWQQGQLREIYVTTSVETPRRNVSTGNPLFVEIVDEASTPQLAEYFDLVGVDVKGLADNYRSEVNLAAFEFLSIVADRLQQGYVLTIDYGYTANRYYNRGRSQGTLQCYYQHQHHNNPYINIGEQDITAHVNFTALERWGERCGLDKVGFTQQELFLVGLGWSERMTSLVEQQPISQLLSRRDALRQLINPLGLGGFGVLMQSKGLTLVQMRSLKGFTLAEQI